MTPEMLAFIDGMKHSPAHNYVIPGLTSWLIGAPSREHGCLRMFTMSRDHEEPIIPHSHRFDFRCMVLEGQVRNHIWKETRSLDSDEFEVSDVAYEGKLGLHQRTVLRRGMFRKTVYRYHRGEEYAMRAEEFHSIYFSRGTKVLFFEGPSRLETSQVLEPVVSGERIPLFKTEDWMFRRESIGA